MNPIRMSLAGLALALALAACGGGEPPAPSDTAGADLAASDPPTDTETAPVQPQAAADPAPLQDIDRQGDHVSVAATFDPAIAEFDPRLAARIGAETETALEAFETAARQDHAASAGALPAYSMAIDWAVTWQGERLISLKRSLDVYSGGAHPNYDMAALNWDREAGRAITPADLFGSEAAAGEALLPVLREELVAARASRLEGHDMSGDLIAEEVADLLAGPDALPSIGLLGEAGAAPTLVAYFPPYSAGPYAEGSYEISLPRPAFLDALVDPYTDIFNR